MNQKKLNLIIVKIIFHDNLKIRISEEISRRSGRGKRKIATSLEVYHFLGKKPLQPEKHAKNYVLAARGERMFELTEIK